MTDIHLPRNADWLGLSGRVCVVTGAAGGIGSEIARLFAQAGARVAVLDREGAAYQAVANEIREAGGEAVGIGCDITDEERVAAAAATCEEQLGRCSILVNNAAAIYPAAVMAVELEKWNQQMSVNLTGSLLCARAFGQQMIAAGGGCMVHVASISGTLPQPFSGAYSVSKAGLMMLSQLLSVELADKHIRSNVVSPALVRTPMSEDFYKDPDILRRRMEIVPSRRIGGPRDIAEAVLFVASDRASYINGQEILVDGGVSRNLLAMIPRPGYDAKEQK